MVYSRLKVEGTKTSFPRDTLDEPDGWECGWMLGVKIRRQQGVGGVMFWARIKGDVIVGPYKVPQGVKINSGSYCELLGNFLRIWLEDQPVALRENIIFQHDNAPANKSRYTSDWLKDILALIRERDNMAWISIQSRFCGPSSRENFAAMNGNL